MKTLFLALLLISLNVARADFEMSGPSVGPSGIGVGKAADGSFKLVDTKTQKVVGDLGLAGFKDVEVHTSWNKSGTGVEVLVCHDTTHRQQRLFIRGANGTMTEVKFTAPDPVAELEAKNKTPFAQKANPGSDCSDLGMWTNDTTAWFIAGVTKEVRAGGSATPTSTVTVLVTFSVKIQSGGMTTVAIETVMGPLKDNIACERRDEFLQNWEQRNALTDSVLQ
jgi:hypothetical protein